MTKFSGPLGTKTSQQTMKTFDIPDYSDMQKVSPKEFNKMNNARQTSQVFESDSFDEMEDLSRFEESIQVNKNRQNYDLPRITSNARQRIEYLLGITKSKRSVVIEGITYEFTSLSSSEFKLAFRFASQVSNVESNFELRKQLLARSLTKIDDLSLEDFLSSNDIEDKLNFIDALDNNLINRLFEEYNLLVEKCTNRFSIKSVEDVKEVSEDIKK